MRQRGLHHGLTDEVGVVICNPVRAKIREQIELRGTRFCCALVGEIDDFALCPAVDRAVRRIDEIGDIAGMPMVAPGLAVCRRSCPAARRSTGRRR